MKIILVDDETKFVSMLAKRLRFRGIDAHIATSGEEAIGIVSKIKDFDAAVLDIKMPDINGLDLKNRLYEINKDLRFIFVTGHGAIKNTGKNYEANHIYLSKPLNIDILIDTLEKIVDKEK